VKDVGFNTRWQALLIVSLLAAGLAICSSWRELILNYKKLVNLRIGKLRAMEELPEMTGSFQIYYAEDELYPRTEQGEPKPRRGLNFSDLERQLPWVFFGLYALFLIGVLVLLVWFQSS
jgi:hypothetical protein